MVEKHNNRAIITEVPVPGVFICGRYSETADYRVIRTSGARDWLITFTLSGEGMFRSDARSFHVRRGDLTLLKPDIAHEYATSEEKWEFMWAHFLPRPTWMELLVLPEETRGFMMLPAGQLHERIEGCFRRMIRDNRGVEAYSQELAMNALEEILLSVRQQLSSHKVRSVDPRIRQVLQIFGERLEEAHTLPSLAHEVNMSPSRLSHLFREQVGDSVLGALMAMRLRQAARLLSFTDRSVADVAEDVGFSSPFYFTKKFRLFYGASPREYRRRDEYAPK